MMKKKMFVSMFAIVLMSAMALSACGKITLPTLLVMDPAATNTLTISLPASLGGGSVVSNLVGNVDTSVIVDTTKLISPQGVPATVKVNTFAAAGSAIMLGTISSGTLCTSIPAGATAGGIAYLRPLIYKDATFQLTIPTETKSASAIVQHLIPPIPLTLNIDAKVKLDLVGLINLMLKGTGLNIHQVLNLTIPATIPLLGGSAVVLDTTLKSTKTKVTDPKLDECQGCPCDTCGDGKVGIGETCDTAIAAGQPGACPTSCTAPNACTASTLQNPGTCTAKCVDTQIVPCCGNGVVETGEECDPPAAGTCSDSCKSCIDQSGTWITRVTTTGTITAPSPVGTLTGAVIDVVQKIYISEVGGTRTARLQICSLSTTATSPIPFSVDYSAAVLASMNATGSVPDACYLVGDTVVLPSFTINVGWDGKTPPNPCPIPGTDGSPVIACPGAIDSDGDGIYGITLTIHLFGGALNLIVYAGLTMNISMANMVLTDANTITGTTAFPTNGYIFSGTSGATGVLNFLSFSNAVPITLVRLSGDVPCATVLTHCTGATCIP